MERLCQVCEKVKKKGIGILCITNQLNSRFRIFEEVSIIRNHVTVRTMQMGQESSEPIFWFYESPGEVTGERRECAAGLGQAVLTADKLRPHGAAGAEALSFCLNEGEVLGICDRSWNTAPHFKAILKGEADYSGKLTLAGNPVKLFGSGNLTEYKIALITGDDGKRRVFDQMNIYDNITIMQKDLIYNKLGMINRRYQKYVAKHCLSLIHEEEMLQRYNRKKELRRMSVSDQLKLEIVRWLCIRPALFIFYKPCASFLALTPQEFHGILKHIRKLRIPILILSDNEEYLRQFCDRILYQ